MVFQFFLGYNQRMTKKILKSFVNWLPIAVVIIILTLFSFVSVQQTLRQSANDPQIELAEDTANQIITGNKPKMPSEKTEISNSLALYIILFNGKKQLVYSSATLDGKEITPPAGILDYAEKHGENRVTWQPKPGVRQALVVKHFSERSGGYVVVGRSLREVEKREDQIGTMFFLTLAFALVGSYATIFVINLLHL